jgi:zinc protease
VFLAEKGRRHADLFSLGLLSGTLRDPDYPALEAAMDVLGSGFTSRLMSQIRTKMGLAYSIGAGWGAAYDHPGTFRIVGSTNLPAPPTRSSRLVASSRKMRTTEVSEQELKTAKDAVLNSFVFFFDSPAKTLSRVLRYQYFDYPNDFSSTRRRSLLWTRRRAPVMRQHIDPANLSIVAVGNPGTSASR